MNMPAVGTIVRVKDDQKDLWSQARFVAYDPEHDYPYICATDKNDDHFSLCLFTCDRWLYMEMKDYAYTEAI